MKPGACSLCNRPDRADIDAGHVAGEAVRALAKRFDVSPTTMQRHVARHIPLDGSYSSAEARAALLKGRAASCREIVQRTSASAGALLAPEAR